MPRKKSPKADGVISLDAAREERAVNELVDQLDSLAAGITDHFAAVVRAYHEWEAAHPDEAVSPGDKLDMVAWGFVGRLGLDRCHDETRQPSVALLGLEGDGFPDFPTEEEVAADIMCPALESGRCRSVSEAVGRPPCILLGAELQQALAPRWLTPLAEDALAGGWCDSKAEEKRRFARAKKRVRHYEKLARDEERARTKARKGGRAPRE